MRGRPRRFRWSPRHPEGRPPGCLRRRVGSITISGSRIRLRAPARWTLGPMFDHVKPSVRGTFILEVKTRGRAARSTAGQRMRTARYQCTSAFIDGIPSFFAERGFSIRGGFGAGEARAYTVSDGTSSVYLAYVLQAGGKATLVLRAPGTLRWWARAQRNAFQEQVHYDLLTAGAQPSAATRALLESDRLTASGPA
jgi:hypothetical protein